MKKSIIISLATIILFCIPIFVILHIKNASARPNIILITIDALRPDHLGCYGYKRAASVNIDKLAKEGVLFNQAISQGSETCVSLPSLHTATYPRTHGVYKEGFKINPSLATLAEILAKNDYLTMAITCNLKHIQGLQRGFNILFDEGDMPADGITQKAINWIENRRNDRFFLWIHYFDPHGPYKPPSPYNRIFLENMQKKELPVSDSMWCGDGVIPKYALERGIRDINYYISQYDGEIGFVDEQIGVLLTKMKELKLDKNLLIIISADHGEALGEHNRYFIHWLLYDEIIRVPLVIKYKKIIPEGKIINRQVESIDISPTILEILRINKPKTMQGKSILSLILRNESGPPEFAFSENARQDDIVRECIRTPGWKLIFSGSDRGLNTSGSYELYNLNTDPGESRNLVNIEIEEFKFLKSKLSNWRKRIPAFEPVVSESLTEEEKNKLKSLGYLR